MPVMADPYKLGQSERRLSPFGSTEKRRDRAEAQRQIVGLQQGDAQLAIGASQTEQLAYIAQCMHDIRNEAARTNWFLEQLLQQRTQA